MAAQRWGPAWRAGAVLLRRGEQPLEVGHGGGGTGGERGGSGIGASQADQRGG